MPLHLHSHYTSGMASMTYLKAIEAGVDVVDTCLAPFALRTSMPAIEPMVAALRGTDARDRNGFTQTAGAGRALGKYCSEI